jgi:hypothetical protein
MPTIVKEHLDPKAASTSNRVRVIVVLLSIAGAGIFASLFLPAESIVPATESQLGPSCAKARLFRRTDPANSRNGCGRGPMPWRAVSVG